MGDRHLARAEALDADLVLKLRQPRIEPFVEFLRRQPRASPRLQTPLDLARGIIAVSSATMERALRVVSVERGHDPRDFALICFGGAGGLHAAELAQSLGLPQVAIPPNPGAFSALGILFSDIVKDVSQSVLLRVPEAGGRARPFAPLRAGSERSGRDARAPSPRRTGWDCSMGKDPRPPAPPRD